MGPLKNRKSTLQSSWVPIKCALKHCLRVPIYPYGQCLPSLPQVLPWLSRPKSYLGNFSKLQKNLDMFSSYASTFGPRWQTVMHAYDMVIWEPFLGEVLQTCSLPDIVPYVSIPSGWWLTGVHSEHAQRGLWSALQWVAVSCADSPLHLTSSHFCETSVSDCIWRTMIEMDPCVPGPKED